MRAGKVHMLLELYSEMLLLLSERLGSHVWVCRLLHVQLHAKVRLRDGLDGHNHALPSDGTDLLIEIAFYPFITHLLGEGVPAAASPVELE